MQKQWISLSTLVVLTMGVLLSACEQVDTTSSVATEIDDDDPDRRPSTNSVDSIDSGPGGQSGGSGGPGR